MPCLRAPFPAWMPTQRQGLKAVSASLEEAAEEFKHDEPRGLNGHHQAFERGDGQVSDDQDRHRRNSGFRQLGQ